MVLDRKPMLLKNIAKNTITGSHKGMRYYICKEGDEIAGYTYPEPFSFANTADEYKDRLAYPWGEEGYQNIIDWINTQYEAVPAKWDKARHTSFLDATTHI